MIASLDTIGFPAAHARRGKKMTLAPKICPNCSGVGLQEFYEVQSIPVHSVVLIADRESAADYPKRDLVLGYCKNCGFITNTVFDPTVHEYSANYEGTQGFSSTFTAFASSLADRLINGFRLKGKKVLEIGCGKGEFISLLCEKGMESGIGFDPTYVPGRLENEVSNRVNFVQEFYDHRHGHIDADLICCRHTLEHIEHTKKFIETIRNNIGDRDETIVFFEVPDAMRVLREAAFWDIYYEHCSYFTTTSLARLFESSGFEILDLRLDYDDQYITLVARPVVGVLNTTVSDDAEELAGVFSAVESFAREFDVVSERWKSTIAEARSKAEKIVLWGSGSKAVGFLATLGVNEQVDYVVDINPHKQGKFMPGISQQIVAPEFLEEYQPDVVVVMNPVYISEIKSTLAKMGVEAKVLALG